MYNLRKNINWFKKNKNITYLDSAATSLKPKSVLNSIKKYVDIYCMNSHNTDSKFSYEVINKIKETRQLLANYLGTDAESIIFTPGATFSLNTVANCVSNFLKEDDEIIITNAEHASNILPWFELREKLKIKIIFANYLNFDNENSDEYILNKITDKTKVISFANGTNLFGKAIDANKIANKIKEKYPNILISIDATQYLSHSKMHLKNSNIDFVSGSAHKMLGPTGIGVLYISPNLIDKIKPSIFGGGMNNDIRREYYSLASGYNKFEAGTLNIMGIYGWNAALKEYEKIDMKSEREKIYKLKSYLDENLKKIPGIKIFNENVHSFITLFTFEKVFSQDMACYLGNNNIIVRSGLSCAKLSDEIINQSHAVRVSMHFYTTKKDIDSFLDVMKNFKKGDELNEII